MSLVALVIPVDMADVEVVQRLITGSAHLVLAELRGEFGELRGSHLLSKRRTSACGGAVPQLVGNGGANGGCQAIVGVDIAMQSIHALLKSSVVKGFLKLRFMKLGNVVVRVREFTPPLAYCAICK